MGSRGGPVNISVYIHTYIIPIQFDRQTKIIQSGSEKSLINTDKCYNTNYIVEDINMCIHTLTPHRIKGRNCSYIWIGPGLLEDENNKPFETKCKQNLNTRDYDFLIDGNSTFPEWQIAHECFQV